MIEGEVLFIKIINKTVVKKNKVKKGSNWSNILVSKKFNSW